MQCGKWPEWGRLAAGGIGLTDLEDLSSARRVVQRNRSFEGGLLRVRRYTSNTTRSTTTTTTVDLTKIVSTAILQRRAGA